MLKKPPETAIDDEVMWMRRMNKILRIACEYRLGRRQRED